MEFIEQQPARNVSNSEVTAFLSCKRMYEYAFMLELAPKETPTPLSRGTLFHYAMELYWRARIAGDEHGLAMAKAIDAFQNPSEPTRLEIIMETQMLWTRYMLMTKGFPGWEPLGVEVLHDLPLTPSLKMTMRYDFYFLDHNDGKYKILDYKTSYDFWSVSDHDVNGQMPKYISCLQANGIKVDGGVLEEIRTRPLSEAKAKDPKNVYRRTAYFPSIARKKSVLRQHIAASIEIERFRSLPPEERKNVALPVLNKHGACKHCNFKDLCNAELEGKQDLSVDIRINYTHNTYGYNKGDVIDVNF